MLDMINWHCFDSGNIPIPGDQILDSYIVQILGKDQHSDRLLGMFTCNMTTGTHVTILSHLSAVVAIKFHLGD